MRKVITYAVLCALACVLMNSCEGLDNNGWGDWDDDWENTDNNNGDNDEDEDDNKDNEELVTARWLELPETKTNDNLKWYFHTFEELSGCSLKGRNFSFDWCPEERLAHWVAFPLYEGCCGSGRSESWGYDPKVPREEQANLSKSYGENTEHGYFYTRGHQMASSDRNADKIMNKTTFYYTNMTPQIADFNGGSWSKVETKVQSYMSGADTLYVVTGVHMTEDAVWTPDKFGNQCIVPDYYYRAVLYYKKDDTQTTVNGSGYRAIGFWMDHRKSYAAADKNVACSIKKLEELTGVNFFVNLPAAVGEETAAAIEAQDPITISAWQL